RRYSFVPNRPDHGNSYPSVASSIGALSSSGVSGPRGYGCRELAGRYGADQAKGAGRDRSGSDGGRNDANGRDCLDRQAVSYAGNRVVSGTVTAGPAVGGGVDEARCFAGGAVPV